MKTGFLKKIIGTVLLCTSLLSVSSAQMVKGYFPYYRSVAQANAVQYSMLTDVIYAFAELDANGNLSIMAPTVFDAIKANCSANGVRLWVAIGGWGLSGNFSGVAGNAARRATLAQACRNLCITHGLAGIDIDWEFPLAADAANYTAMLAAIKGQLGTTYKLSAALGGESFNHGCISSGHAVGVEAAAFTHLDYFNIMSYDAPSTCYANHTSLEFMQRSMDGWHAKGCPYEKMIPGIAFYGRPNPDGNLWYMKADATHFNDADGIVGGIGFDTKPTIEAKTNYAMCTRGAPGMMIWEISQDAPASSPYDLLPVVKAAVDACACPFSDPNLGADRSLCGTSGTITLNSGIGTASGRTFSWRRNGAVYPGTSPSVSVTQAGTYEVTVTQGSCTKKDEVVVTATLPVPNLGADRAICTPSFYNLAPSNLASFPAGTTWQWKKDGSNLSGETTSSLANARIAGTYELAASISGCATTTDAVVLTSSLPTPVDGCGASTPIGISITNLGTGPYSWYSTATGGTSLHTGTSFNAPSQGTYYVQDGASSPAYNVGLAGPANSFQNGAGDGVGLTFSVLNATTTINSVEVYVPVGASGTVQIRIRNSDNSNNVFTGTSISVNNTTGAMQRVVVPVGATLAVGTYRMVYAGTVNLHVNSQPAYPITNNNISITGAFGLASYAYFFNWQIAGAGSACNRLPVVAMLHSSGCTLQPVELISFEATRREYYNELRWRTASEINNAFFEIERSEDGAYFYPIGRKEGNGNSAAVQEYLFKDTEVPVSGVYYRLAQYDFDGTGQYSPIVSIAGKSAEVYVYPNPFSDYFELQTNAEDVQVELLDVHGRVWLQKTVTKESQRIETSGLPSGIYLLKTQIADEIKNWRLIKQ
jgi:hypothetical protein